MRRDVEIRVLSPGAAFGWGCAGSAAVEAVRFCERLRKSKRGRIPVEYLRSGFWLGRVLLALVAGTVVAAWGIAQPIQGLALGAAAPRLMMTFEHSQIGRLFSDGP